MAFLEHRPRVVHAIYYRVGESTALLFVQQHVKGAIIVDHVTPTHGKKWPLYPDDGERMQQQHCQQPPVRASFQANTVLLPH